MVQERGRSLGLVFTWSYSALRVFLQISIIINSSAPPRTIQNELKPEQIDQLKVGLALVFNVYTCLLHLPYLVITELSSVVPLQVIMSKRYDGSQQALDLKGLRSDPGNSQEGGHSRNVSGQEC